MGIFDDWKLRILCSGVLARGAHAWVESYDGGEDDEKVIKIMLPMIAIAVLACVVGYYIKNKFFKPDDKDEDNEKANAKSIAGMNFPAPKANKPWLNMQSQGQSQKGPAFGPVGGYEYTLPGYQQATSNDKRTTSQQSGKGSNTSSGYQSHQTGIQQVSEKRRTHPSNGMQPKSAMRNTAGRQHDRRRDRPTMPHSGPQGTNPASRPSRGNRH